MKILPTSYSSITPAPSNRRAIALVLIAFGFGIFPVRAAEQADPTAKLRTQLRDVMLQLRTSQTTAANAQAGQVAAEQKVEELTKKLKDREAAAAELAKQNNATKAATDQKITTLTNTLTDREKKLAQTQEALEKWKVGYQQAAEVARKKEEERAKLAAEIVMHQRTIADRERKNLTLFNVSNEILDRYEGYSLGKALAAREPFIGTTRVKVENQVQGYKDQILDNRISAPAKTP